MPIIKQRTSPFWIVGGLMTGGGGFTTGLLGGRTSTGRFVCKFKVTMLDISTHAKTLEIAILVTYTMRQAPLKMGFQPYQTHTNNPKDS